MLGLVLAMILFRHSSSFAVDQRCKRRKEERRIKEEEEEERVERRFAREPKEKSQGESTAQTSGDQVTRWSLALVGLPFAGEGLAVAEEENGE